MFRDQPITQVSLTFLPATFSRTIYELSESDALAVAELPAQIAETGL